MIKLSSIVALAIISTSGCNRSEKTTQVRVASLDRHEAVVAKFQDGQKRFKNLIATVRDEQSYDEARPGIDQVISDWRAVAAVLSDLSPPSEEVQVKFRKMIAEGHRRTESMPDDMLRLISIKTREAQTSAWLEDFVATAGKAGEEMRRLYGPTGYASDQAKTLEFGPSSFVIINPAIDHAFKYPTTQTSKNKEEEKPRHTINGSNSIDAQ